MGSSWSHLCDDGGQHRYKGEGRSAKKEHDGRVVAFELKQLPLVHGAVGRDVVHTW